MSFKIASAVALALASSTLSTASPAYTFHVGSVVSSRTRDYLLVERLEDQLWPHKFKSQATIRGPKGSKPMAVFLRCGTRPLVDETLMDVDNLRKFQSESWCPRLLDEFQTGNYSCIVSELVESPLLATTLSDIMSIGLKMLSITEDLHTKHSVNHRSPILARWSYRTGTADLVLSDLFHLRSLKYDKVGYHRIEELQWLGANLRELWNAIPAKKVSKVTSRKNKCPGCPEPLAAVVEYVFSINPENGEFPEDMYSRMRSLLTRGAHEGTPSREPVRRKDTRAAVQPPSALNMNINEPIRSEYSMADEYVITEVKARGHLSMTFAADMRMGEYTQKVTLKCIDLGMYVRHDSEFYALHMIRAETWAPRRFEEFLYKNGPLKVTCMALELFANDIVDHSKERGIIVFNDLMILAKQMWAIIKTLHIKYETRHGNINARNWLFRDNKMKSIVLTGFEASEYHILVDRGAMMLSDIKNFAMVIRYLRDLDPRFIDYYVGDRHLRDEIHTVCPTEHICPKPLRKLLSYTMTLPKDFGNKLVFTDEIYKTIDEILGM